VKKQEQPENLFSEFPPVSREKWENEIEKDLRGADYKQTLKWDTLEGVSPLPFYRSDDLTAESVPLFSESAWRRCEPVYESSLAEISNVLKAAEQGGADAFKITCELSPGDKMLGGNISGARIHTQEDFDQLFEGIDFKESHIMFESCMASPALLAMLKNHYRDAGSAAFLFDPFTWMVKHARKPHTDDYLQIMIRQMSGHHGARTLAADGLFYHHAGATLVQELGIVLAIASEYLASFEEEERSRAAQSIWIRLSAGPLYFPEIAKFRAIRILWKKLLPAYGIDHSISLYVHAETSPQNKTVTDPYNNMIRATTEAMAAVLGGTDSLTITPFDAPYQKPNAFSARIARNVHHIIREEAYLAKTADPSAGSYYIEQLTTEAAKEAWNFFRLIEKQGGFVNAVENGVLQSAINESKDRKMEAFRNLGRPLIGTSKYINSDEKSGNRAGTIRPAESLKYTKRKVDINTGNLIESLREHFRTGNTLGDVSTSLIQPQKVLYRTIEPFNADQLFGQEAGT
jgi:methylmalonyl-CoA mutase